jgi:hypothetical protein
VGRKTTHRLTNTRNFGFRETEAESVYIHMRNAASMRMLTKARASQRGLRLYSLHTAWHRYMDRTFKYLTTSGLNGIVLGLHRCRKVRKAESYATECTREHRLPVSYATNW